jgi:hypothetical protein
MKLLRKQSKDFDAAGFDARDGTSVSMFVEDMSRNKCFFFLGFNTTYFEFYTHLWPTN